MSSVSLRRPRRGLTILEAVVSDGTGTIKASWFNQGWLAERLQPGTHVRLRGQTTRYGFTVKSYDLGEEAHATADFAPVYPASEEIAPKKLRELVEAALPLAAALPDPLPAALKAQERLPFRDDALHVLHRPRSLAEAEEGRRRLAFDELLVLQVGLAQRAREREATIAPALGEPGELIERYRAVLPFTLTEHQERAIAEIDSRPRPRGADAAPAPGGRRLRQDRRGALHAPARGGARAPGRTDGADGNPRRAALSHSRSDLRRARSSRSSCSTSSLSAKEHAAARGRLASGEAAIAVGTHALIQSGVDFADLAVAVVDEQHRFGVEQRRALSEGRGPHVLHMTATPIPRTLALTVYGDLQISEIAKPPADRVPVVTRWIPQERASEAYTRLKRLLDEGRQAYVVCPLIEASETSVARAAEDEADRLRRAELKGYRVGCLHGRLKPRERRELMARFKACDLDVLVATTVIEVGVDVPNATVMIVQEADRFGLAQLHQLRGRVGRGSDQSYCLLVSRPKEELTESAAARLEALVATSDGFELAEVDLELRGSGQLLGTRQAGLSDFHFARLRADRPLLERARAAAGGLAGDAGPLQEDVDLLFGDAPVAA